MYHPTTRVFAVLELLQTHGRLSGADMAARMNIDQRTLRRYIAVLEEMGMPITAQRGRFGGYALMPGFRLAPMMFSEDEALALSVGLLAARDLGMSDAAPAVVSAQAKLERIMPAALKNRVRAVCDTVRLDLARVAAPGAANGHLLATLSAATLACQRVQLDYRALDGHTSTREIDPYGLAFHAGAWYVLGMCHLRASIRSFRLDRVQKFDLRAASFARPIGFDVLAYLRQSLAQLPRSYQVEVLLCTDLVTASSHFDDTLGMFELAEGGVVLRSETDDLDWFSARLAAVPCDFEVRQPQALRERLRHLADRLLRLGASQTGSSSPVSPPACRLPR